MHNAETAAVRMAVAALRQRLTRRQDAEVYIWLCYCPCRPDETRAHWWAGVQIIHPRQRSTSGVVLCDDGTCYATPHLPSQSRASHRSTLVVGVEQWLALER